MALFKYNHFFTQTSHTNFDALHGPGTKVPDSGIYRCEGCGHEIAHTEYNILPPQNHHQHSQQQGAIRWRLVAASQTQ